MASMDVWDVAAQQMVTMPRNGFNPCVFWNDTTTPLAASAAFTGASRDAGATAGAQSSYSSFNTVARADQPGTIRIEGSPNGSTWFRVTADVAMVADTPVILTVPVMTRFHRTVVVNGATAQTAFFCNTGYSAS